VTWGEFFDVYKTRNITLDLSIFERIFLTMEDPESSYVAQVISIFMLGIIMLSSFSFILGTLPACQHQDPPLSKPKPNPAFEVIETSCLVIFCIEYLLRVLTVWAVRAEIFDDKRMLELVTGYNAIQKSSPAWRLLKFIITPSNVIDLAAILPAVLAAIFDAEGGGFVILRLIRLTRIFRAFKSPALAEPVTVIGATITKSTKALYVLVFNLLLGIVIFGSLMFLAEGQDKWDEESHTYHRVVGQNWNATSGQWDDVWGPSPFQSIPHSFWWAMVTAATVGYGDHYPTTPLGKSVAVMTMVFSLVILALPVGVMGGTFSQVWADYRVGREEQARKMEEEEKKITGAIQRLDPVRLSNLLLIEVWSDESGEGFEGTTKRPHYSNFLGEVTIELDHLHEHPEKSFSSQAITLKLESNYDILKRDVTGTVTIKYEWAPASISRPKVKETNQLQSNTTMDFILAGKLKVSLLHANNLVNVCSTKKEQYSNPYCIMVLYPRAPQEDKLRPTVWRTPTVSNSVKPKWEKDFAAGEEYMHEFTYNWSPSEKRSNRASKDLSAFGGRLNAVRSLHGPLSEKKLDSVLDMLQYMENELGGVRQDVLSLHSRIGSASKLAPPSLANVQPPTAAEEDQPDQGEVEEGPPLLLPGSVPPES